jgi:NAD(P)-dependent dehydrogenase (short-subunit alcohol dehydrogenase family)
MRELEGKVAVVTGGGSGIGAAVGKACHAEGMTVAVVDIDRQRAFAVADEMDETGERSAAFGVDVADAHAVDVLAAEVFARFGGCHLLHNNAGLCPMGRAWDHSAEEWQHVVGVNLLGVAHGVNAFVPRMLDQGTEAHIVNTASAAALRHIPSSALYNATKFGVLALTESLRADLAPHGIGVSALCPGGVATNIADSMRGTIDRPRSDEEVAALLGEFASVDAAHITVITPERVGELVLEGVRDNAAYIITHPGSLEAVSARHAGIQAAYRSQHDRYPELP